MGILRRLFSVEFRQAVAEEAAGNFVAAARCYAMCGETHKVVDMHLAQARAERDADDRIHQLRLALRFSPERDQRRPMVLRMLGAALDERGRALGPASSEGRELLRDAVDVLAEGGAFDRAGEGLLVLGEVQAAADMFARGGLLERVEAVLGEEERLRRRRRTEHERFADYEMLMQDGQRDEAAEALRHCVEAAEEPARYRRLLADLEERILTGGRVLLGCETQEVTLIGTLPVVLGRDADCDLQVRGPSVSRRHALLVAGPDGRLTVQDAGSRNGTTLDGLALDGAIPLPDVATVGLGPGCAVRLETLAAPLAATGSPPVRVTVTRGFDPGRTALVTAAEVPLAHHLPGAPPVVVAFRRGRPMARAEQGQGPLLLQGVPCHRPVQLVRGDTVEAGGRQVEVR